MDTVTFINGEQGAAISVMDRGFMYGDGVFETLLACKANLILWEYHYARLTAGCERLRIAVPESEALLRTLTPNLDPQRHQVIKIVVTRGEGQRGYRVTESISPNVVICISARHFLPPTYWENGIHLYCCATRLASQPGLAGIKHLNRLEQVLATQEWDATYQEGLMCNAHDEVIEATSHNLFAVKDGQLYTPDLTETGVEGVMRRYVIELAREMRIAVYIKRIKLTELAHLDEIFLTNSIDGIWPVTRIGEWQFKLGEIARALQTRVATLMPYQ